MRYRGNKIGPDERTNARGGQLENIMRLSTLSGDEDINVK